MTVIVHRVTSISRGLEFLSLSTHPKAPHAGEARRALMACSPWFLGVAVFSAMVNILYLVGPLYMLQVYDRVLASRSVPTLIALSLIALVAFLLQGQLDGLRARMLARIGARFDELLSARIFQVVSELPLRGISGSDMMTPLRDVDQVRGYLSSLGPTAFFDMPFMPIFLFATFLLHPTIGWLTVAGAVVIIILTLLTDVRSRGPAKETAEGAALRLNLIESTRRNAETIFALGMRGTFHQRFLLLNRAYVDRSLKASDVANSMSASVKTFRIVLQSAALGLGAYLAILGEVSPGVIIAASILTSRALAPIETAVSHWKGFTSARMGYLRLKNNLDLIPPRENQLVLPKAHRSLVAEQIVVGAPGGSRPIVEGASLKLEAGDGLGLIGSTGSGKSSLVRALVGIWQPMHGAVRLDGATLDQWGDQLGSQMGYLPQSVELFEGTIAENIARFRTDATDEQIIEAAQSALAHEMILSMPAGYGTKIAEGGTTLSGGQRQRIALARALYGRPFLVVLDEPNANLDSEGDQALTAAIVAIRERGGIAIIITHRPSGLAAVNKLAVMRNGHIVASGPRDEVLASINSTTTIESPPPRPSITEERSA